MNFENVWFSSIFSFRIDLIPTKAKTIDTIKIKLIIIVEFSFLFIFLISGIRNIIEIEETR